MQYVKPRLIIKSRAYASTAEWSLQKVKEQADELEALSKMEAELTEKVNKIMMTIPNIIDESVPKDPLPQFYTSLHPSLQNS